MLRVNINNENLIIDEMPTNWGTGVLLYNGQNFTGIVFENFENTNQLSSESEYKNGIPAGRQVEYWQNGLLKKEYFEKFDYTIGSFKIWNEQGIITFYAEYDDFGNLLNRII